MKKANDENEILKAEETVKELTENFRTGNLIDRY